MARPVAGAPVAPKRRRFGIRDLARLALWGMSAVGALTLAVYAGTTAVGRERLVVAVADIREAVMPTGIRPVHPLDAREGRRLAETVRALSADRERLLTRLASIEQSIDGITGSIARVEKATRMPPPESADGPTTAAPPASPPEEDVTSSIKPQAGVPDPVPMPPPPPGSAAVSRTEFGLDLGGASTVEALRTAWTAALRRHGPLLQGLHPVVQMRDRPKPGGPELRLVAGPIANAATAARLCASMTAAGSVCAPATFEGQRLAGR